MSFARFGRDGSHVYVFRTEKGVECCGCILDRTGFYSFITDRGDLMLAHLNRHREKGGHVPLYTDEAVRKYFNM